jgi:hypothetical protein
MRWRDIREDLAAHRAHARQASQALRAMDCGETALAQARAAWEAGHPVQSAADLAAILSAPRAVRLRTGAEHQAEQLRQAHDPEHVHMAACEMEHAAEIRASVHQWLQDAEAGQ